MSASRGFDKPARTERGFDRLVNFSDAVVAIAITLLVLPLVDVVGEISSGDDIGYELNKHLPTLSAFIVTFFVAANFWMVHHRIFERLGDYDAGLMWLDMGWLICMVFLPFPSALVSEFGFAHGAGALYCGTMALISVFQGAICLYAAKHTHVLAEGVAPGEMHPMRSLWYVAFFAVVAAVSLVWPSGASWSMLLLIPFGRLLAQRY